MKEIIRIIIIGLGLIFLSKIIFNEGVPIVQQQAKKALLKDKK